MSLLRSLFALGLFLQLGLVNAQNNTLLWRISGNGLTRPSYLFGTIHVTDKRVFNFDDSVFRAMEASEGFAMEVNPDEMAAYIVNRVMDDRSKSSLLRDVMDERDFERYRERLEKKFDKPADDIRVNDVVREKNRWVDKLFEKGQMQTFMDAYLYDIARRQGKYVAGLENIMDQAGLLEEVVDESDIEQMVAEGEKEVLTMEKLIQLYLKQDIEGLESSMNLQAGLKDRLLVKRNIKMAVRIDSLAALRPMFFAVGTAHLPGEYGLIQLMREKGYTVQPVFSKKKIKADDYKFEEKELPWFQISDKKESYSVMMPGNPATVKVLGVIEMKFFLDLTNMSGYATYALTVPAQMANPDSFERHMRRQLRNLTVKRTSRISDKGKEGLEFIFIQNKAEVKAHFYFKDNSVFMLMCYSANPENTNSPAAKRFLSSLQILERKPISTELDQVFTDSIFGIRVRSTNELEYNEQMSYSDEPGIPWRMTSYTSEEENGAYLFVMLNEIKAGNYLVSDSVANAEMYASLSREYELNRRDTIISERPTMVLTGRNKQGFLMTFFPLPGAIRKLFCLQSQTQPRCTAR